MSDPEDFRNMAFRFNDGPNPDPEDDFFVYIVVDSEITMIRDVKETLEGAKKFCESELRKRLTFIRNMVTDGKPVRRFVDYKWWHIKEAKPESWILSTDIDEKVEFEIQRWEITE